MAEYDEFGNIIGGEEEAYDEAPPVDDATSAGVVAMEEDEEAVVASGGGGGGVGGGRITLHEEKRYYPEASSVYPGAATVVLDEDAQPLEEPILKPARVRTFSALEEEPPEKSYSVEFMRGLMERPELIRNVAIVGSLHSGKTVLVDALVQHAHRVDWDPAREFRYADARHDEQDRELSIKATPVSLVLPDSRSKSWLVTCLDCPGHSNFSDEVAASLRISDGCVLVVDAVEGVVASTERVVRTAIAERAAMCLVVNKVDRLILELKLPPADAYLKLANVIDEVNATIEAEWAASAARFRDDGDRKEAPPTLDPRRGDICFASAQHCWCFTLESFAGMYRGDAERQRGANSLSFSKKLWGDVYFDERTRVFSKTVPPKSAYNTNDEDPLTLAPRRSFVFFVLEPLYKIYARVLGEDATALASTLGTLGIRLRADELSLDPKPLLKVVFKHFFRERSARAFVDVVARLVPSPKIGGSVKVDAHYDGDLASARARAMMSCDEKGPLTINVVKMYSTPDATSFASLGRVYSGTARVGSEVRVLGEAYSADDQEDSRRCVIMGISVPHGRHATSVESAGPGNCVLFEGVDASVRKTATIVNGEAEAAIFRPLRFSENAAIIKLAVEPLNPAELPKMTEGLRKISKSYPLAATKVEESGEHVVSGTGELYMDCIMRDLREMYSNVEIKVADPVVGFRETVAETSSLKCFSETPNKRNKLTMIAEPLDRGVAEDVERGDVDPAWPKKKLGQCFQSKYDWDLLAARSIWAFGPDPNARASSAFGCSCVLVDDALPSEVDKRLLGLAKDSIVQGFQWGCREGPLCDEPVRGVKFKILDAAISDQPLHRSGGQLIPTSRRVCYSAFLMASPRLMEPILSCEIACPADCVQAVYPVLARRRGHVVRDAPKPGAPFYLVDAFIPAIDSFGFETDLRAFSQGQAMCSMTFDHWALCPGDPLDRAIILHPLEPSPPPHLAREFMVKTRRRKGLSEDVAISKYFDDPLLRQLAEARCDDGGGRY
ncbi:hypothetical protein CTAYLR_003701 [Chrysophaeum taylorii]|uniref:116 kDa U5 small nuclear ribonucleoprotein component n=1 Tax=Chrysophaeum taylorii TaxID=2483200 RepID=A0AAD7UNQ9_9STRA|nr:hypothetical protein CTAYLR_003701 [Chrysophaeum taylorii]